MTKRALSCSSLQFYLFFILLYFFVQGCLFGRHFFVQGYNLPEGHTRTLLVYININNVGTRFVTTRNSVGFVRKKTQTISFVERGFEKARPQSPDGGFFVVFIYD